MLVLRGASDCAKDVVGLVTALLGCRVKSQGIVVNDSQVVSPGETLGVLVKVRSKRMSEVLLSNLVSS